MRYQPVVDLDDGVVRGVEAFPRSTSGGGVDGRSPLGEQIHTIESLGRWTMDELCRQDRAWRAEGLELDLQFKLAPRQLWSPFLTDSILAPLREAGIRPHRVTVEVSDAVLIAEPERTGKVIHELMAWGLNVALDDFGTDHPSFARLDQVPVQMLKIDRSLIRGIDDDVDQTGIVRTIVEAAERLGMTTQALGVETSVETEVLRSLGVGAAQGFWFGRPVPGARIAGAVRRNGVRPSPD
jgi:EAL domain-containing protein (putative c-di-GMP-specific phosphodiesterase class I)